MIKLAHKKIFFIITPCILTVFFFISQMSLPFGNHLISIMHITDVEFDDMSYGQTILPKKWISENYIKLVGLNCNASFLDFSIPHGFEFEKIQDNSIELAIRVYEQQRDHLNEEGTSKLKSIIFDLISMCDPNNGWHNPGWHGVPPLVFAVFAEELEFVQALLDRGANPLYKYTSPTPSGAERTPYDVAVRLAEIEAQRLEENPNHPKSRGQAQSILDIIIKNIEQTDLGLITESSHNAEIKGGIERN